MIIYVDYHLKVYQNHINQILLKSSQIMHNYLTTYLSLFSTRKTLDKLIKKLIILLFLKIEFDTK